MSATMGDLIDVFRQVFDDDELVVTRDTSAVDVEGWDSLAHVTLVLAVERRFGVKLKSSQVTALRTVGDLADLIDARRK